MGKTKTIEVAIRSLKTTSTPDDKWMETYEKVHGYGIEKHPNYRALKGDDEPLKLWFASYDTDWKKQKDILMNLLEDIKKNGMRDQIKIYRDGRINTGHKRAAIMHFLGETIIRVEVVQDDYKL